jgi:hypothetical protein
MIPHKQLYFAQISTKPISQKKKSKIPDADNSPSRGKLRYSGHAETQAKREQAHKNLGYSGAGSPDSGDATGGAGNSILKMIVVMRLEERGNSILANHIMPQW